MAFSKALPVSQSVLDNSFLKVYSEKSESVEQVSELELINTEKKKRMTDRRVFKEMRDSIKNEILTLSSVKATKAKGKKVVHYASVISCAFACCSSCYLGGSLFGLLAILSAIAALREINANPEIFNGKYLAYFSLVTGILFFLIGLLVLFLLFLDFFWW